MRFMEIPHRINGRTEHQGQMPSIKFAIFDGPIAGEPGSQAGPAGTNYRPPL
jgi:hypothetical protein